MSEKQRRDYGSGSISQRKDGTWTARMVIGVNEKGKPRIKALYGKTEREVKKKLKEFQKEFYKNDQTVVQKNTVESYMLNWLHTNKKNTLKPKSYDRLEQTITYQVIPQIGHIQLAAIQANDVQNMINNLAEAGMSCNTYVFILNISFVTSAVESNSDSLLVNETLVGVPHNSLAQ